MMGSQGFNALQIILASGFPGVTELGCVPESVVVLASLPERVSLVRANESVNFKLAAKRNDPVRSDTTVFRWLVEVASVVVVDPDYYLPGAELGTFQVLKRVAPPAKHPTLGFVRLPIKFVSSERAASGNPELWLRTVVLHNEETVAPYIHKGVRIGV
jgi:hypothetical protein